MAATPTPEEGKYKDIPSILPLAPGGVYAVKWEQREKWAQCIETPEVPYEPPLGEPNPDNPLCFFEVRSGGYYLGRVVFELKADTHPITAENFLKLCEYHCYAGTMFKVFPGNWIRGGDFTELDDIVYDANDPDFFDFASLLPDAAPGGQSIYVTDAGPYFDDEKHRRVHARRSGRAHDVQPGRPKLQRQPVHDHVPPGRTRGARRLARRVRSGCGGVERTRRVGAARRREAGGSDVPADHRGAVRGGEARAWRDGGWRGGVHVRGGVRILVGKAPGAWSEEGHERRQENSLQSGKVRRGSRARREVRVRVSSTRAQ